MPFLLLLLLSVILVGDSWPRSQLGEGAFSSPALLALYTWSGVALVVMAARFLALRTRREIQMEPDRREAILQHYASRRLYHLLALFVFYGVSLFVLGWGSVVQYYCTPAGGGEAGEPPALIPGAELLILAPFLIGLVGSWAWFYDAEKAVHDQNPLRSRTFWSRRAYLSFHLRQNLALIVAPLGLMIAQKGLQRIVPNDWQGLAIAIGLAAVVFVSLPWILRLVLGLQPLPEGPLRQRLLAAAERLRLRFSDILVWNTNGGVANAMVAGLLPYPRYVLLTDRLINELRPEEVEAVFGHEVGHVRHGHMLFYVGFLLASMGAVAWAFDLLTDSVAFLNAVFTENQDWAKYPFVGIIGAYVFLVFGFLSRRCERQADIFGCRAISCDGSDCRDHGEGLILPAGAGGLCATGIHTFIDALEKVARLNGISRHRPGWLSSWQHSTIARRVQFLYDVLADPGVEKRFQWTVARVKWGLLLGLAGIFVALALLKWGDQVSSYLAGLVT
jgi:Zn-dependent protease with chaperone function